jgi:type IV secretory pathway VirB2 component (pilin)
VLLALVAVGLAGYSLWRLMRAALGHGPEGSDSASDRVSALGSGVVYAGLCVIAVEVLFDAEGSSSAQTHRTTAGVLGWPAGTWLVAIAGVALIGIGLYQGYRAFTRDFLEDAKVEQMSRGTRDAYAALGTFGYLARMVVFLLVGSFLIQAAVDYDSRKARGLDGALAQVAQHSYGHVALGLVAAGLIAFGLYSLADARYRRI